MAIPALAKDFKEFLKSLNSNEPAIRRRFMKNQSLDDNDMPAEIDFSKGFADFTISLLAPKC